MVAGLLIASSVAASLPSLLGQGNAAVLRPTLTPARTLSHTSPAPDDAVSRALARAVGQRVVPANLTPSLADATNDKAAPFLDGCDDTFSDTVVHPCVYGDPHGTKTIVVFGDSHAAMYQPGFDLVAKLHHWRLISISKATCTPYIDHYFSPILDREFSECEQFRNAAYARIAAEHPALVVVSVARHYGPEYHFRVYSSPWLAGIERVAKQLSAIAQHVVILGPTPKPPSDIPSCLSAHLTHADQCALQRATATNPLTMYSEATAANNGGAEYIDVTPWFCTNTTCPAIVGNLLVYRDDNHITTTYAAWLAPRIDTLVTSAIAK
jgi:hypothetical protein